MSPRVTRRPGGIVNMRVVRIERRRDERMRACDARIEDTDREVPFLRKLNAPGQCGGLIRLLGIRPLHELRRRVPCTADFCNGLGIQEQTPDRQLVAKSKAHFAVGKYEVLWLDENPEMAGSYVE